MNKNNDDVRPRVYTYLGERYELLAILSDKVLVLELRTGIKKSITFKQFNKYEDAVISK